jgi:hypothetical protein
MINPRDSNAREGTSSVLLPSRMNNESVILRSSPGGAASTANWAEVRPSKTSSSTQFLPTPPTAKLELNLKGGGQDYSCAPSFTPLVQTPLPPARGGDGRRLGCSPHPLIHPSTSDPPTAKLRVELEGRRPGLHPYPLIHPLIQTHSPPARGFIGRRSSSS